MTTPRPLDLELAPSSSPLQTSQAGQHVHWEWDESIQEYNLIDVETGALVGREQLARVDGRFVYSMGLADRVASLVQGGATFTDVAKIEGMPPARVLMKWMTDKPNFREKVQLAKKIAAENAAQDAVNRALTEPGKDEVAGVKLAVETLKWQAEKLDPENWGSKVKISGDAQAPLQLIIDTGIRRPGDPGFQGAKDVGGIRDDISGDVEPARALPGEGSGTADRGDQEADSRTPDHGDRGHSEAPAWSDADEEGEAAPLPESGVPELQALDGVAVDHGT